MWIDAASTNDLLTVVLSRLKLHAYATGAFDAGGTWAIGFPRIGALSFKVITKGECWLAVEGQEARYHLRTGDCFLVTGGRSFVLAKDLKFRKTISSEVLARRRGANGQTGKRANGVAICNGGGAVVSIGTMFNFEGHFSDIVFRALPAVIHIAAHMDQGAVLRWSLERFGAEFHGRDAGHPLMMSHLAPIILLQALRVYLSSSKGDKNWLIALSHPKLSKALEAMHVRYGTDLTLDGLALTAGMSRAGFASHFKTLIGVSPMHYLTHWRMQVACDLLQEGTSSVAAIANAVGYDSESAFSATFKRIIKRRPGAYQRTWNNSL